jgi:nucleoside-diphosphate-sugar epimerase
MTDATMLQSETVLIAGCGDLGTAAGLILASSGNQVFGLRRRADALPAPLHTLRADLSQPATLTALPPAIDLVYYIATPASYDDDAYRTAYVDGLHNLLQALRQQQQTPRRLVLVSSTAVYGQLAGEWVDETSPTVPNSFSGRRMLESEQLAWNSGIPSVILRFGGIYGPGRERMIRAVKAGEPCPAEPSLYTNRIHRDDCVQALAHVAAEQVPPGIYLATDDAPCTQCELMDWLANRLGLPQPARTQGPPGGRRGSNNRCRNDKLKSTGFQLRFPSYREGYGKLLESFPT